jgi:hypothetical protein
MFYSIVGLCPRPQLGGHGFSIKLYSRFRDAVAERNITQEDADHVVSHMGRMWLDACGYDGIFDPDNCGYDADPSLPPGPRARPLYEPNMALRVRWGEWGPEHIDVPGNACGLDINTGLHAPRGGRILHPHNVDCWSQVNLLLIVFTWFADDLALNWEISRL